MLGYVLGLAMAVQGEPKLEWATFGDFSARLNEGSGYRLVMDKSISDRPMVWYFSIPGESRFELLRRSCKELCLNFEVDDALKKVFVIGPNGDAGPNLYTKLGAGLRRARELTSLYKNLSDKELKDKVDEIGAFINKTADPTQRSRLEFDRNFLVMFGSVHGRLIWNSLEGSDPSVLANLMVKQRFLERNILPTHPEIVRLYQEEMARPVEPARPGHFGFKTGEEESEPLRFDDGVLSLEAELNEDGASTLQLKLVRGGSVRILAQGFLPMPGWLVLSVPAPIASELWEMNIEPSRVPFWGHQALNDFQTVAVENGWNTVSWLNPKSRRLPVMQFKDLPEICQARASVSKDGWLALYENGVRYPEYRGDWKAAMQVAGKFDGVPSLGELTETLDGLSDEEMGSLTSLWGASFSAPIEALFRQPYLLRAALREAKDRGVSEFRVPIGELGDHARRDLAQYWRTASSALVSPEVVENRRSAVLVLLEQGQDAALKLGSPLLKKLSVGSYIFMTEPVSGLPTSEDEQLSITVKAER